MASAAARPAAMRSWPGWARRRGIEDRPSHDPASVVMWDKEIKKAGWHYGEFMVQMNTFALHLRDALAPAEARRDIEDYLQTALGYPIKKPLAKYIDEYNWWLAWGLGAIAADTSAPSTT
jgi:hypothetical protein